MTGNAVIDFSAIIIKNREQFVRLLNKKYIYGIIYSIYFFFDNFKHVYFKDKGG